MDVTHNPAASRFEATVDGHLCVCQYRMYGKLMMLVHTGVPSALRGRGIAAALVRAALDHARARGFKVRADCSYAAAYIERHPESQDLLLAE
jgi:predicted GNAT family acetyltransferase